MKKIMILAAGVAFATSAYAQPNISFAPEVGLNLANMHRKDILNFKYDDGIKLGFRAGVNVNIPVTPDRVVVQPGLFYSIQGMKSEENNYNQNFTLHYVQIPVNVLYMFNDPSEGRFFVGVGPYIGFAVSGKEKRHGGHSPDTTISMTFGSGADQDLGRVDYGAQVTAGYLLRSGIFFRGTYQHGIGDLVPSENVSQPDAYTNNTCIVISVGYQLGHAPKSKGSKKQGAASAM